MEHGHSSQRVFHVPELLCLILDSLDDEGLACMARVANLTHKASIQRLWGRTPRDASRFIELFPPGLLVRRQKDNLWIFSRDLEESDWTRFKRYSVHITNLGFLDLQFCPSFFSPFINLSNQLFPLLRCLSVQWPTPAVYVNSEWLAVAGKALQVLNITNLDTEIRFSPSNASSLTSLFQQLPLRTPFLNELNLPKDPGLQATDLVAASFCFVLPSLLHLTKLAWAWEALPFEIINAIRHHPHLCHIKMRTIKEPLKGSRRYFSSLTWFYLDGSTTEAVEAWLSGLARPDLLEKVTLGLRNTATDVLLQATHTFVRPLSQATNLTEVEIAFFKNKLCSWTFLEPLLGCKLISKFILNLEFPMKDFDSGALEKLATSWRMLRHIEIYADSGFRPAITICGLHSLALCCPELSFILLDIMLGDDIANFEDSLESAKRLGLASECSVKLELYCCQSKRQTSDQRKTGNNADARRIAQVLRGYWPTLEPQNVKLIACDEDGDRKNALAVHLQYVKEFVAEMELRDRELRKYEENKRLLENKNDQLAKEKAEEKARLTDEKDQLARNCARLEQELSRIRIKGEEE